MSQRLKCYTLFDITCTGIRQRNKIPEGVDVGKFIYQRNTQNNLDTILQIISLRSQPETVSTPQQLTIDLSTFMGFGFMYDDEAIPVWYFEFDVHHSSVFDDGVENLGYLYRDCDGIPMIKCGTEYKELSNFLDTNIETKNIYFELL